MLVSAFGMQLHASVTVDGRDRRRLERVCRYLLHPPFAQNAVRLMPDGHVRVSFKRVSKTGAAYAQMSPQTFLARLCALVPPPGFHHVRYYGVLAGRHALRKAVAPSSSRELEATQLALFVRRGDHELPAVTGRLHDAQVGDRPPIASWSTLLARVFRVDVSVCARCGVPMRIVLAVTDPHDIAAHLHRARAPPRPPPPGQTELFDC